MSGVHVAYIGNFKHAWCTEVHLARELEGLGCRVTRLQEPREPSTRFVGQVESYVQRNDVALLLFTRTWGLHPSATDMWRRVEKHGVTTASYHLDLYYGLRRQAGVLADPFWRTQFVFTPDGDPNAGEFFAAHGINHVWSPPAVVSDACDMRGTARPQFNYEVVFVGSERYHREWPWRGVLLDHLAARYGSAFRRFGGDTPEGPIREQDLVDLYATARVVVGDSLALPGHVNYWSDRPYETVGRGGFLLMPRVPGLEQHFEDRKHLRFYDVGDLDEIDKLIDYYFAHPSEGWHMAFTGREHVKAHHTYRHRLAVALDTMGLS